MRPHFPFIPIFAVICISTMAVHLMPGPNNFVKQEYPIPPQYHPFDITPDAARDAIAFWSPVNGKKFLYGLYLYDLKTNGIREVLQGSFGWIDPSPISNSFAVEIDQLPVEMHRKAIVVFDHSGSIRGKFSQDETRGMFFPNWSPDGEFISFNTDRPGLTDESSDFDPDNFTAIGVLDTSNFESRQFGIHPPGYSQFWIRSGNESRICVAQEESDNPAKGHYAVYGPDGHAVQMTAALSQTCLCQGRKFYISSQKEIPSPFAVYSCKTFKPIKVFPAADAATDEPLIAHNWNPRNDDLFLVEWSKSGGNFETQKIGVYSVSMGRFVLLRDCSGFAWSANGKNLVLYQNGSFVVEPIQP